MAARTASSLATTPMPGRMAWAKAPRAVSAPVTSPPRRPTPTAAVVLASANSVPSVPVVSTNIDGSINGEASQNAMTGASGTPMAKSAAISGMTPQEQKGDSAPTSAAAGTIIAIRP